MIENFQQYYRFNPEELQEVNNQIEEIKRMSLELGALKNKKDEDTITYF